MGAHMGAHDTHQTQGTYSTYPVSGFPTTLYSKKDLLARSPVFRRQVGTGSSASSDTHPPLPVSKEPLLVYHPTPPPRGIECPNFDSTCTPTATFDPRVLSPRSGAPRGKRGPAQALHRLLVRRGPRHDAQPSCQARHGDSPSLGREQRAPPASQSNGRPAAEAMGWKEARRPPQAALGSVA